MPDALRFQATLTPHRSLSPRGLVILLAALGGLSTLLSIGFFVIGAWPVLGFLGIDLLLLWLAFWASNRRSTTVEIIRLTDRDLILERIAPDGRRRLARLEPTWVRVELGDPPDNDEPIRLRSHGRAVAFGLFLAPEERADLAAELRRALSAWRSGVPFRGADG